MLSHRVSAFAELLWKNSGRDLLRSTQHSVEVSNERCSFIIRRAQLIARLFSLLTVGWTVIDLLTTSWPLSGALAAARLAAALAFAVLAEYRFSNTEKDAQCAVGGLIGTAALFCLAANVAFLWFQSEASPFATNSYLYAPFLIAVSISIFPLTLLECALLALSVIATMAVTAGLWSQSLAAISVEATLLRLGLMSGVVTVAAMSQLQLLIRLAEQSARDALTGVLTRRSGEQLIDSQFALAARNGRPLAVLFIDLDRFKQINDCFGHAAGDDVLRQAAQSLRSRVRRQDIVMRWGGEEFVVVLQETDSTGALGVIAGIAKASIGSRPDGTPQTASFGVAERIEDEATDWAALVELADKRMYAAKQAGRNRYVGPNGRTEEFLSDCAKPPPERDAIFLDRVA